MLLQVVVMPGRSRDVVRVEQRRPIGEREAREFCQIYEASFPAGERDDTAAFLSRALAGARDCYLAVDAGELLGFAVVLPLAAYPVAFLEYLAVAPEARNAGIGGCILTRMRQRLAETVNPKFEGVLFEVDQPEDADGSERELRRRRIAFYQRHGATIVDGATEYRAPVPAGGTLPYFLMWLPVAPGASPPAGSYLKGCVTAIYAQSYELRDDAPLVRELIARIR
jgi:GNAT superfamily N-acetyltransferase